MLINDLITLLLLILLQIVLGVDNLLYISLESRNAPIEKQKLVRNWGIGVAVFLRIALLFALVHLISYFKNPLFEIKWEGVIEGGFNLHSLIVLGGGIVIFFSAIKGIWNMISMEEHTEISNVKKGKKTSNVLMMIIFMNLIFSFDSILSAMALTDSFWLMTISIIINGIMMLFIAEKVSTFLKKNRMYEVLGMFILFLVGVMLLSDGGHLANLSFFNNHITPMNNTTFYFVVVVLLLTDIVQSRYKKKLLKQKDMNNTNLQQSNISI